MKTHELKTLTGYYQAVKNGTKTFEVRYNDRDFKVGDILILKEYDGTNYSGDFIKMKITFVLDNKDYCKDGFVVLGIKEQK